MAESLPQKAKRMWLRWPDFSILRSVFGNSDWDSRKSDNLTPVVFKNSWISKQKMMPRWIEGWGGSLLDFLLPPECFACHRSLASEKRPAPADLLWCDDCRRRLAAPLDHSCPRCGAAAEFPRFPGGRCPLCRRIDFDFQRAISVGNYVGELQRLIREMKGGMDDALTLQMGAWLGWEFTRKAPEFVPDVLVPVPTYWINRWRRRIQISEVLAEGFRRAVPVKLCRDNVYCRRKTAKQGTLLTTERFENVKGAFGVRKPEKFRGQAVLVIDDVMTSGATANQIAKVLKRSGARSVYIATVARGARLT